jgi:hypothetical protein
MNYTDFILGQISSPAILPEEADFRSRLANPGSLPPRLYSPWRVGIIVSKQKVSVPLQL